MNISCNFDIFIVFISQILVRNLFVFLTNNHFEFLYQNNLRQTILFNLFAFIFANFVLLFLTTLILSNTTKYVFHFKLLIYYAIAVIFSFVIIIYIFIVHMNWINVLFLKDKKSNDNDEYKIFFLETSFFDVISVIIFALYISIKFSLK